jgi:hypothetical protein
MSSLQPPRHISTLPRAEMLTSTRCVRCSSDSRTDIASARKFAAGHQPTSRARSPERREQERQDGLISVGILIS